MSVTYHNFLKATDFELFPLSWLWSSSSYDDGAIRALKETRRDKAVGEGDRGAQNVNIPTNLEKERVSR